MALFAILPFMPSSEKFLAALHASDSLATSGLILTIFGFVITIWQLRATRTASEAATFAIQQLRMRISEYDDAMLCKECIATVSEIERQHQVVRGFQPIELGYALLPEVYRSLRMKLTSLRARQEHNWSEGQKTTMQDTVSRLQEMEIVVPLFVHHRRKGPPNIQPLQNSIMSLSDVLIDLSEKLTERAKGGRHDR